MMNLWYGFGIAFLVLFLFQNCSPYERHDTMGVYSYKSPPDFFFDVKLVRVEIDENRRELYVFDLALSYAHDPDQNLNYRMDFSTLDIEGVCRSLDGTARGRSKHVRLQCLIPTEDDLYVRLILAGPEGEIVTEQYRF